MPKLSRISFRNFIGLIPKSRLNKAQRTIIDEHLLSPDEVDYYFGRRCEYFKVDKLNELLKNHNMLNINEHLEDHDYGEGHPERMIRLMQAVRDYNEVYYKSYPAKVTAEAYIQWSKFHLKDGGDDRAWSGGICENN